MQIVVLSAIHGRPEITDLFLTSLVKCIGKANTTHRYIPFVVATPKQGAVCFNHGISYCEHENRPLGRKWNSGLKSAKDRYDPDYVMILGSDDFISPSYLEYIDRKINQGYDVINPMDIYYYSLNWKRRYYGDCGYYAGKNTMLGVGRVVHRHILDNIKWEAWDDDINNGMDSSFLRKIMANKPLAIDKFSIKEKDVFIVDIKSHGNIGGIGAYALDYMDSAELLPKVMDDSEIKSIKIFKEGEDKKYTEKHAR